LFILIRGWFFDKSWKRKRARNTFTLFLIVILVFGLTPMHGSAQPQRSKLHLWFWEHVNERVEKMYGGAERMPALEGYAKRGFRMRQPLGGERSLVKDSLFYFMPDRMRKEFEGIWPKSAKNVAPPSRRGDNTGGLRSAQLNLRHWQSARAALESGADTPAAVEGASEVTRDASLTHYSLLITHHLAAFADAFNSAFGVPAAHAWDGLGAGTVLRFYHTDHLGSTRVVTDEVGEIYERIDYLPFGEIFRDDTQYGTDADNTAGVMISPAGSGHI
jgi:hypothetical protein